MFKLLKGFLRKSFVVKRLREIVTLIVDKKATVLPKTKFYGWGLASKLALPTESDRFFAEFVDKLLEAISTEKVNVTQFGDTEKQLFWTKSLIWRYYMVYTSVFLALTEYRKKQRDIVLVEFGVADGLTASSAAAACMKLKSKYELYLYDSFSSMQSDQLTNSEMIKSGDYSYLSEETTKSNLMYLLENPNLKVCKGYLPKSFELHPLPSEIDWVSIDLNTSAVTLAVLNELEKNLKVGAIIILDDYGHNGFEETMNVVQDWINQKTENFSLVHLPTGQCLLRKIA